MPLLLNIFELCIHKTEISTIYHLDCFKVLIKIKYIKGLTYWEWSLGISSLSPSPSQMHCTLLQVRVLLGDRGVDTHWSLKIRDLQQCLKSRESDREHLKEGSCTLHRMAVFSLICSSLSVSFPNRESSFFPRGMLCHFKWFQPQISLWGLLCPGEWRKSTGNYKRYFHPGLAQLILKIGPI